MAVGIACIAGGRAAWRRDLRLAAAVLGIGGLVAVLHAAIALA